MSIINDFFVSAGEREPALRALDELICQTVPKLTADRQVLPGMAKQMLSYGMFHYVYPSGREGDWPVVALAAQKHYISLYISAVNDAGYLADQYSAKLGKVDVGKSCIRFKQLEDLDLEQLKHLLTESEAWWQRQPKP